jgi:hypothetical protein
MRLAVFERGLKDFGAELSDFDPALISTADAARAFAVFNALEKMTSAARTRVTARATEARDWEKEGHRSPAGWVAQKIGGGLGEGASLVESSERLVSLPETTEALRRGELSGAQVREITAVAIQNPQAERDLLAAAKRHGLKGLKEECLRVKARAVSEKDARAKYEEIRKNRSLQMWTDQDGVGRLEARLTPDDFARVHAAIQTGADVVFHEARKSGHREASAADAADALVALVSGTSLSSSRASATTTMHLRVDLAALRRGELEEARRVKSPVSVPYRWPRPQTFWASPFSR